MSNSPDSIVAEPNRIKATTHQQSAPQSADQPVHAGKTHHPLQFISLQFWPEHIEDVPLCVLFVQFKIILFLNFMDIC